MKQTLILLALSLSIKSFGCDCLTPKTADAIKSYNVIFVGRITQYHDSTNLYSSNPYIGQVEFYNFEIIRYFKGLTKKTKIVSIIDNGTNCDIKFKNYNKGDTFLVYANIEPEWLNAQILNTHICSRTKLVSEIVDKDELDIYNDNGAWKSPEYFEKLSVKVEPFSRVLNDNHTDNILVIIFGSLLVVLNATIIIILLKRKK